MMSPFVPSKQLIKEEVYKELACIHWLWNGGALVPAADVELCNTWSLVIFGILHDRAVLNQTEEIELETCVQQILTSCSSTITDMLGIEFADEVDCHFMVTNIYNRAHWEFLGSQYCSLA